jgi:hypothetical protein
MSISVSQNMYSFHRVIVTFDLKSSGVDQQVRQALPL